MWWTKTLYVNTGTHHFNSLAAAKAHIVAGGFSARIDYEGRPLMYWCPISGWEKVAQ